MTTASNDYQEALAIWRAEVKELRRLESYLGKSPDNEDAEALDWAIKLQCDTVEIAKGWLFEYRIRHRNARRIAAGQRAAQAELRRKEAAREYRLDI